MVVLNVFFPGPDQLNRLPHILGNFRRLNGSISGCSPAKSTAHIEIIDGDIFRIKLKCRCNLVAEAEGILSTGPDLTFTVGNQC